jgi:hypothetical protein
MLSKHDGLGTQQFSSAVKIFVFTMDFMIFSVPPSKCQNITLSLFPNSSYSANLIKTSSPIPPP